MLKRLRDKITGWKIPKSENEVFWRKFFKAPPEEDKEMQYVLRDLKETGEELKRTVEEIEKLREDRTAEGYVRWKELQGKKRVLVARIYTKQNYLSFLMQTKKDKELIRMLQG